jgi:hypothetical protein
VAGGRPQVKEISTSETGRDILQPRRRAPPAQEHRFPAPLYFTEQGLSGTASRFRAPSAQAAPGGTSERQPECPLRNGPQSIASSDLEGKRTLSVAAQLLQSGIELMIVFNPIERLSAEIAAQCARSGVPAVATTFPLPGAVAFGVDNYRASLDGGAGFGRHLSRL